MDMTPREYQQYVQRKMKKSPLGTERLCVNGVECVFNVYECRHSAELLRFCNSVERNRCLTARCV